MKDELFQQLAASLKEGRAIPRPSHARAHQHRRAHLASAAVALPLIGLSVQDRATRGNWECFDRIVARVPDAPPVPGDER